MTLYVFLNILGALRGEIGGRAFVPYMLQDSCRTLAGRLQVCSPCKLGGKIGCNIGIFYYFCAILFS